jgi:hypothetical protein
MRSERWWTRGAVLCPPRRGLRTTSPGLDTLEQQLLAFGRRYEQIATPFERNVTRADRDRLAHRLKPPIAQAA